MLVHLLDVFAHDTIVPPVEEGPTHTHGSGEEERPVRNDSASKSTYTLELFGITTNSEPARIIVNGFYPSFYVQIPAGVSAAALRADLYAMLRRMSVPRNCPNGECWTDFDEYVRITKVQRKLLFGYTANRTFPVLHLEFKSSALFWKAKRLLLDDHQRPKYCFPKRTSAPLEIYDANLDPLLKFFHCRQIEPCGWVEISGNEPEFNDLAGRWEIECEWDDISAAVRPKTVASAKIISWDIECISETGAFPLPENKGDPVIQIGVVIAQVGKPTEQHCFVLGTCSPVEEVTVHCYRTERDLLIGWAGKMCEWDPDMLIGYNIFGFDERYVWKRAELFGISEHSAIQGLSRLDSVAMKLQEKMLSSSALGDNRLYMWNCTGRIQADLYNYVKRIAQLPSYKLDDVTSYYMSGKMKGVRVTDDGLLCIKASVPKEAKVGRSVKLLSETGDEVAHKCEILSIDVPHGELMVRPQEAAEDIDISHAKLWAIVKDDVPPAEIFRLHREGGAEGRAKIAKYCVQDCVLVVELFNKLDVFNNAMSMANICSVPMQYIFTRGQGIKIESLIFRECHWKEQIVKVLDAPPGNFAAVAAAAAAVPDEISDVGEESYEGAIVLTPRPDFYFDSPVGVCDFASLYPSSIISENISYDTLAWVKDISPDGSSRIVYGEEPTVVEPGVQWTDIEFDVWGKKEGDTRKHPEMVKTGLRVCRYAQFPDERKGTLPDILRKLLKARKEKRKEAEKETDPFRKAILDSEQLAYKVTANSLYGQLGSATFKIRLQHLAASTTAYGRKQIMFAYAAIEEFYGPRGAEILYGDTDSLFVSFNPRNAAGERLQGREAIVRTIELTEECGKYITQALKSPHDFEYDKVFWPFIIFSKKRYIGNKYEESPDEFKQNSMGTVLKRRDNAPIVKKIYNGATNILLNRRNVAEAAEYVRERCRELVNGETNLGLLTITKSLRDHYDNPNRIAHKVLADRIAKRDPGNAPAAGDRVPYIYIQTDNPVTLQGDRIETPAYIREKNLKPDVGFYITNQLENPIAQLFSPRVEDIPGFSPERYKIVAEDPEKQIVLRETAAAHLLFGEALASLERTARRHGAERLGFKVRPPTVPPRSVAAAAAATPATATKEARPPTVTKQLVLDSWFATKMLVDSLSKKRQQKKDGQSTK